MQKVLICYPIDVVSTLKLIAMTAPSRVVVMANASAGCALWRSAQRLSRMHSSLRIITKCSEAEWLMMKQSRRRFASANDGRSLHYVRDGHWIGFECYLLNIGRTSSCLIGSCIKNII